LVESEGFKTATGDIIGSPLYMSPEQAKSIDVTPKSDIYSLGCVMWQCLSGTSPFQGETAIETIMNHQYRRIEDLDVVLPPAVPETLAVLIAAMLSKETEARPEFGADILPVLVKLRASIYEEQNEHHHEDVGRDIDRLFEEYPATVSGANQPKPFLSTKAAIGWFAVLILGGSGFAVYSEITKKTNRQ